MKDPAFLFYPNDYLGGTLGMTFEEKGAYMELLMLQFNRGHMTTHMIGHTLGQNRDKLWETIKTKFICDQDGNYYNERLEDEQRKRKAYSDSRRKNIKGINQYTKEKDKGHMDGHMTSHMEDENENINDNRYIVNINELESFLKNEQIWFEQTVCMRHHLTPEQAGVLIHEFVETLKDRAEETKTPKDAKTHFINWLKKRKEKQNDATQKDRSANTKEYRAQLLMQEYEAIVGKPAQI